MSLFLHYFFVPMVLFVPLLNMHKALVSSTEMLVVCLSLKKGCVCVCVCLYVQSIPPSPPTVINLLSGNYRKASSFCSGNFDVLSKLYVDVLALSFQTHLEHNSYSYLFCCLLPFFFSCLSLILAVLPKLCCPGLQ